MNKLKKFFNFKVDWSQGSTQRAVIILPFAIVGVVLIIIGRIEAGIAVVGLVQTIYSTLGIAVSDTPIDEDEFDDYS